MIEGNLRHLPLNEVFQIIVTGQKSGILSLIKGEKRARIYFEFGRVQYAYSVPGIHIGEMLVRMDLLTPYGVQVLQNQITDPAANLGMYAVSQGLLEPEVFENALKLYITELLTDLLSWKGGSFHFSEKSLLVSQAPPEYTFDAMALLMEVIRRHDEWDRGLAGPKNVFTRTGDPSQLTLPEGAWEILSYLNGRRSASSIAADMDIPDQEVYRLLYLLEKQNIITLSPFTIEEPLVFIVVQDQLLMQLVQLSLRRHSMYPFIAKSYDDAQEQLQKVHPQLIVLEKRDERSWDFVKDVRKRPGCHHLPIIMLEREPESVGILKRWNRPKVTNLAIPFYEIDLHELIDQFVGRPGI